MATKNNLNYFLNQVVTVMDEEAEMLRDERFVMRDDDDDDYDDDDDDDDYYDDDEEFEEEDE